MPDLPRDHVVMCSGSNSAGALSSLPSGGFYFRTAPPDRLQQLALARLVATAGRRRPVVIAATDSYGTTFGRGLVAALRREHTTPRLVPATGGGDATAVVTRALAGNPDAVVLVGFPDSMAPVLRALVAAGKGPIQFPVYGTDALQTADLGGLVDPANPAVVAGLSGTTPAGAPAGVEHPFTARMFAAGVEPFFSASAYDCTILIGLAAVAAKSDDADAIRTHIAPLLRGQHRLLHLRRVLPAPARRPSHPLPRCVLLVRAVAGHGARVGRVRRVVDGTRRPPRAGAADQSDLGALSRRHGHAVATRA